MKRAMETIRALYGTMMILQIFADAGTVVNTTTGTANAYTGATTTSTDMTPGMKTFYNTQLLENARMDRIYGQFAKKQTLPENHGVTVEWRKFNTFDKALTPLVEGVIPTGEKFGQTVISASITQHGSFTAVSDKLDLHHVDPVIAAATEEMGAAGAATEETLLRNNLVAGTNVMYAPKGSTPVTSRTGLDATAVLTAKVIKKAVTLLKKNKAPKINGDYIAVVHTSVAEDLSNDPEFVEWNKYTTPEKMWNGEIGKIHGARVVESPDAPVIQGTGIVIYATLVFGRDAYGEIDPEGGNMKMYVKPASEVGGPIEQFSTIGYKFETGSVILYQERMVRIESGSSYSSVDQVN